MFAQYCYKIRSLLSLIKSALAGKKHLKKTEDLVVLYGKQHNGAWRKLGDYGDQI